MQALLSMGSGVNSEPQDILDHSEDPKTGSGPEELGRKPGGSWEDGRTTMDRREGRHQWDKSTVL